MEIIESAEAKDFAIIPIEYSADEKIGGGAMTAATQVFIKLADKFVIFATSSAGDPVPSGNFLAEIESLPLLAENLQKVLDGKLFAEKLDSLNFKNGGDEIIISASSVFPSNSLTLRERISLQNLRESELDGLDLEMLQLSLPPETMKRLHIEIQKLLDELKENYRNAAKN